jgi:hypothetical protein
MSDLFLKRGLGSFLSLHLEGGEGVVSKSDEGRLLQTTGEGGVGYANGRNPHAKPRRALKRCFF